MRPSRSGRGVDSRLVLMISQMVSTAAIFTPTPGQFPRDLCYPHSGVARASLEARPGCFRRVTGRPVLPLRDRAAQRPADDFPRLPSA